MPGKKAKSKRKMGQAKKDETTRQAEKCIGVLQVTRKINHTANCSTWCRHLMSDKRISSIAPFNSVYLATKNELEQKRMREDEKKGKMGKGACKEANETHGDKL